MPAGSVGPGLRQGDIVTVVPGPDGRPRLQRVTRGQVPVSTGGEPVCVTRTVVINNASPARQNARATYMCVRLCVALIIIVVAIVGGIAAGVSN